MNSDIVINDSAFNIGQLVKYKGREAAVIDVFWVTLKDTWVYAVEGAAGGIEPQGLVLDGQTIYYDIPEKELSKK